MTHLPCIPLFHRDEIPRWGVHVYGGDGRSHIKRNFVFLCQNCYLVGPYFVGHITVGGNPVCAGNDHIDFFAPHQGTGGIVCDHGDGNVVLHEFKRCQSEPLKPWPGLIRDHLHLFPSLMGRSDYSKGGPVSTGCQGPRIAMGQDGGPLGNESLAVFSHLLVDGNVFCEDLLRLLSECGLYLCNRMVCH